MQKKYLSGFKYILPDKILSSKNSNIKSGLKNQPTPTLDIEPKININCAKYDDISFSNF